MRDPADALCSLLGIVLAVDIWRRGYAPKTLAALAGTVSVVALVMSLMPEHQSE